jgi:hypothetical protein
VFRNRVIGFINQCLSTVVFFSSWRNTKLAQTASESEEAKPIDQHTGAAMPAGHDGHRADCAPVARVRFGASVPLRQPGP